jgi:hypothetical protein
MHDPDRLTDDALIDAALGAEERALLRSIGEEPSHVQQAIGLFEGRNGWVNVVLMVTQAVLFAAGLWAGWRFFVAETAMDAIHWGLPAAVALIMALMIKIALYPVMQTQRLLREIKRLELLMATR